MMCVMAGGEEGGGVVVVSCSALAFRWGAEVTVTTTGVLYCEKRVWVKPFGTQGEVGSTFWDSRCPLHFNPLS